MAKKFAHAGFDTDEIFHAAAKAAVDISELLRRDRQSRLLKPCRVFPQSLRGGLLMIGRHEKLGYKILVS